jgi:hypothetical protein
MTPVIDIQLARFLHVHPAIVFLILIVNSNIFLFCGYMLFPNYVWCTPGSPPAHGITIRKGKRKGKIQDLHQRSITLTHIQSDQSANHRYF